MKILLINLLVLLVARPSNGHTGDLTVARENSGIEIDGHLGDWPPDAWQEAPYYDENLGAPDSPTDFNAAFAVAWQGDRLFVAARIRDDHHHNALGIYAAQGDNIWLGLTPGHFLDTWDRSIGWSYALASTGDSVSVSPEDPPGDVAYLRHRILRFEEVGETHYEASIRLPARIEPGQVHGFLFSALDNDLGGGMREGFYQSSPPSMTLPGSGVGDILFAGRDDEIVSISGMVAGVRESSDHVFVHAFHDGELAGSDLCDAKGAFAVRLLPGRYRLAAFESSRRSAHRVVDAPPTQPLALQLGQELGSIAGRVTKENGVAPVPLANVLALQGEDVKARVYANDEGYYTISGLGEGTYDLVCHVASGDTIRGVAVALGKTTDVRAFTGTGQTFDRLPWSDEVFEAARSVHAYDRDLPLDPEVIESVEIAGYVREKIMLSSTHEERFPVYLALPMPRQGPYPCLLTLHAGSTIGKDRADFELIRRRMTAIGYAVAALDAKLFNERHVNGRYRQDFGRYTNRDAHVQTVVDYRRLIDYLGTRAEVDTTRIGIYGGSMGTFHGTQLAGVEERIKAYVMRGPGLGADQWNSEFSLTDQLSYIPRFPEGMPVILLTGYYDSPWAVQGTLRLIDLLKGPVEAVYFNTTHTVPPQLYMDRITLVQNKV